MSIIPTCAGKGVPSCQSTLARVGDIEMNRSPIAESGRRESGEAGDHSHKAETILAAKAAVVKRQSAAADLVYCYDHLTTIPRS